MDTSEPGTDPVSADPNRRCQWCSAPVPDPAAIECPACGASIGPADPIGDIPGLTVVDPDARNAERRAARNMERAKMAGTGAMFGLTGMLLSQALPKLNEARRERDAPGEAGLDEGTGSGSLPGGLTPTGLVPDASGPAATAQPDSDPWAADPAPAPSLPANLPPGVYPAVFTPVGGASVHPSTPPAADTIEDDPPVDTPSGPDPWRDLPPETADLDGQIAGTEWDPWAGQTQDQEDAARPYDPWSPDGGPWSGERKPPADEQSK